MRIRLTIRLLKQTDDRAMETVKSTERFCFGFGSAIKGGKTL